jgi:hypothetical protein
LLCWYVIDKLCGVINAYRTAKHIVVLSVASNNGSTPQQQRRLRTACAAILRTAALLLLLLLYRMHCCLLYTALPALLLLLEASVGRASPRCLHTCYALHSVYCCYLSLLLLFLVTLVAVACAAHLPHVAQPLVAHILPKMQRATPACLSLGTFGTLKPVLLAMPCFALVAVVMPYN